MNDVYVFLDSTRTIPQSIQHKIIQIFASNNNLKISFYGAEFKGYELRHNQLKSYILSGIQRYFLFYSVYQFYDSVSGFNFDVLYQGIFQSSSCFYFAAESLTIESTSDLLQLTTECKVAHINLLNSTFCFSHE